MFYVSIIIIAILTELLLEKKNIKNRNVVFIRLIYFFVAILIAFRSKVVGADTENYFNMYKMIGISNFNEILIKQDIEYGYILLTKILYKLSDNPQMLLVVQGIVIYLSYTNFFVKNTRNAFLTFLAYMSFGLFSFQLTGIRQSLAMAITVLSFEKIKEKKFFQFLIIILLAAQFHTSALYFIVCYPIAQVNPSSRNRNIILGVGALLILLIDPFLKIMASISDRYSNYGVESTGNGLIFFLIVCSITILGEVYKKSLVNSNKYNKIFIMLNYINFILWAMRLVTRVAERPSLYFMPFTIVLFGEIFLVIKDVKTLRLIYSLSVLCLIILFLYRMLPITYSFLWIK